MSDKSPLQRLRDAFAQMTGGKSLGDSGRLTEGTGHPDSDPENRHAAAASDSGAPEFPRQQPPTPRSILEAMLFVGHPENEPLTRREAAALMRGVSTEEIDALVEELNASYDESGTPYRVVSDGPGYRMVLRDEFDRIRHKFYGRIRDARLSRACVEVLSIVAYHQPITTESVNELRSAPSGPFLAQLVRRQLLQMERPEADPQRPLYRTTGRFLRLFGLANLEDLPRSEQIEQH